jgi:hypothetical protein
VLRNYNGKGSSDSNLDISSDNDGGSSEEEQKCPSTRTHSPWSELDEQRLLVYKKENKSWPWLFCKFPDRTRPAVRTRWNMIRLKVE